MSDLAAAAAMAVWPAQYTQIRVAAITVTAFVAGLALTAGGPGTGCDPGQVPPWPGIHLIDVFVPAAAVLSPAVNPYVPVWVPRDTIADAAA